MFVYMFAFGKKNYWLTVADLWFISQKKKITGR